MKISEIQIPKRTRKDMGDLSSLAASINELGLLHVPVVNGEGELICGERRLRAVKTLGWEDVPVRVVKTLGEALLALKAERDENTQRKDFAPTEAVALGERLEKLERGPGRPKKGAESAPFSKPGKTRSKVGEAVGMGATKYVQAKSVVEAAKANPALVPLVEEMDRTGNVNRAYKNVKRHVQKQEHAAKVTAAARTVRTPSGPFDLVLADPPWKYDHCEAPDTRQIENQYPTATLDDIFKHSPNTKPDSILFLWATAPKLTDALEVMKAWGYNYRSCAVWDKEKIGMGYWWRIQHELLLVGVKGNPTCTPEAARVSSVFREARTKHSIKPACVYEWIERAFPSASKLEMYARVPRKSWAAWGDEV